MLCELVITEAPVDLISEGLEKINGSTLFILLTKFFRFGISFVGNVDDGIFIINLKKNDEKVTLYIDHEYYMNYLILLSRKLCMYNL